MRTWFRRCTTLATLALTALALTATSAAAQKKTSVGFLGGADFTDISDTANTSFTSSTGFAGGFYVAIPVAKSLMVEPELFYTHKGAGLNDSDASINLNYIEIPILLRYEFTQDGGPFAYVGPYVAFNVKCNTTVDTLAVSCADDNVQANTVIGGAVGVGFQKQAWGFDIRYEYDFGDAVKQESGKNSALMILLRLAIN